MIQREKGSVRSIDVVNELGFSKPSVSVAMKNLEASGYIERDSAGHIYLLPPGKAIAESIYARHTTLVKLLTHIGQNQGNGEAQNVLRRFSLCHIYSSFTHSFAICKEASYKAQKRLYFFSSFSCFSGS